MSIVCLFVEVGLHDGTIVVYNVSIISTEPVLDSWSVTYNCAQLILQQKCFGNKLSLALLYLSHRILI